MSNPEKLESCPTCGSESRNVRVCLSCNVTHPIYNHVEKECSDSWHRQAAIDHGRVETVNQSNPSATDRENFEKWAATEYGIVGLIWMDGEPARCHLPLSQPQPCPTPQQLLQAWQAGQAALDSSPATRYKEALEAIGNVAGSPTTNYSSSKMQLEQQTDKLNRVFTLVAAALAGPDSSVPKESASNYVCDNAIFPTVVTFADGRVVRIVEGERGNGYLDITPKSEYPKPCGICSGVIQSRDDLDWHGYGNCRDIPDPIMKQISNPAAGQASPEKSVRAIAMRYFPPIIVGFPPAQMQGIIRAINIGEDLNEASRQSCVNAIYDALNPAASTPPQEAANKREQLQNWASQLRDVADTSCGCPTELDGPAKSPDSVFRTRHKDSCEVYQIIASIYAAGQASVSDPPTPTREKCPTCFSWDKVFYGYSCDRNRSGRDPDPWHNNADGPAADPRLKELESRTETAESRVKFLEQQLSLVPQSRRQLTANVVAARMYAESSHCCYQRVEAAESRVSTLLKERDELRGWKESAISVTPDYQEIGKLIGVELGQPIHDKILPAIRRLVAAEKSNEELAAQLKRCHESFRKIGNYCAAHQDVIDASWVAKVIDEAEREEQ